MHTALIKCRAAYTAIKPSLHWYPIKHSKYKVWFLPSKHSVNNRSLHCMFVSSDVGKMGMAWGETKSRKALSSHRLAFVRGSMDV